jgi:hypothetical protein
MLNDLSLLERAQAALALLRRESTDLLSSGYPHLVGRAIDIASARSDLPSPDHCQVHESGFGRGRRTPQAIHHRYP